MSKEWEDLCFGPPKMSSTVSILNGTKQEDLNKISNG